MPIVMRDVTVRAEGREGRTILHPVSGEIAEHSLTLLIGRTGSGKSTLLKALAGLTPIASGTVDYNGTSLWRKGKPVREALLLSGMAFQFPEQQLFAQTVQGEFDYSLRPYRLGKPEREERIDKAMSSMKLPRELLGASPLTLSGGQKRRVALASLSATQRPWLFLDEPSACLDAASSARLKEQLLEWKRSSGVVMATHDWEAFLEVADRVLILSEGRLVADMTPEELRWDPELLEQAGVGLPGAAELARELRSAGLDVPLQMLEPEKMAEQLALALDRRSFEAGPQEAAAALSPVSERGEVPLMNSSEQPGTATGRRLVYLLDARVKWLVYTLLSAGFVLQTERIGTVLSLLLAFGAVLLLDREHAGRVLRLCKPLLFFMAFASSFAGLRVQTDQSFPLSFAWEGAAGSFAHLLPFFSVTLLGIVFTLSTSPVEMKQGLQKALSVFDRIGWSTSMLALAASLVLRFIPLILEETRRFALIAQARGKRTTRRGQIAVRDIPVFVIPLLISLFQTVEDLIMAMEIKGYINRKGLSLSDLQERNRATDAAAAGGGLVLFCILLGVRLWSV
ncbi:ATP-binding cassette domain-containing protein [Paenibacillus silviterrae]|uniref:ATP-binding cassette domain-containing protein n=1 Tax=Paenibacillus silviterrae TaxID=3242194 RepID=UPI002543906E|nr:ATP-binding cassette domain-containing protein [Paenibacillus chinjuensis]